MKFLNKMGYTKVEIMIVIILLGIVSFITINTTSYAFSTNNDDAIEEIYSLIEYQASNYAMDNLEMFENGSTKVISVNDLVEAKYLLGNEMGLVTNPADPSKNFNDNRIKLEYDSQKQEVKATVIE